MLILCFTCHEFTCALKYCNESLQRHTSKKKTPLQSCTSTYFWPLFTVAWSFMFPLSVEPSLFHLRWTLSGVKGTEGRPPCLPAANLWLTSVQETRRKDVFRNVCVFSSQYFWISVVSSVCIFRYLPYFTVSSRSDQVKVQMKTQHLHKKLLYNWIITDVTWDEGRKSLFRCSFDHHSR